MHFFRCFETVLDCEKSGLEKSSKDIRITLEGNQQQSGGKKKSRSRFGLVWFAMYGLFYGMSYAHFMLKINK